MPQGSMGWSALLVADSSDPAATAYLPVFPTIGQVLGAASAEGFGWGLGVIGWMVEKG